MNQVIVELSNTLDTTFCVRTLERALAQHGTQEIFNTDQSSQFTSTEFTSVLQKHGIKISMDGRGRCLDNVFVERLWRTLKYEEVYLKTYQTLVDAHAQLEHYIASTTNCDSTAATTAPRYRKSTCRTKPRTQTLPLARRRRLHPAKNPRGQNRKC